MDTFKYSVYYLIFKAHMSNFLANHLSYMGLVSILVASQLDILNEFFLHGVIFVP